MLDKMITERVDLRQTGTTDVIRAQELVVRRNAFGNKGFSTEWISALELDRPTLYSPLVLESHTQGLLERGFTNPNKMIESLPAILGYAFENIDAKLAGLRERGFTNPNKMIESSPAIFSYAFENIDRRLNLIGKLINLYELPFSAPTLMEQDSALFSSKIDKILVLVRVLRHYKVEPPELNENIIRRILHSNLEDTLVALNQDHIQNGTIADFLRRVNNVKRLKLPKEEKRQIIDEGLAEFEKIKKRYFRGYPESIKQ